MRYLCVSVLCLLALPAHADPVINEFLYDPSGSDGDNEWIEIFNPGPSAVDVSDWQIERAKSSWDVVYTIVAGPPIPAGGYLLIGEPAVAGSHQTATELDLGNGGSDADAVRLLDDSGTVIDSVVYAPPNDDGHEDDSGYAATSIAPEATNGKTVARSPDGVDTDLCGDDFSVDDTPTPGAENDVGAATGPLDTGIVDTGPDDTGGGGTTTPTTCDPAAAPVVINELLPDPAGADGGLHWAELYNSSGSTIDLSGWVLVPGKSSLALPGAEIPAGTTIAPGEFLVMAETAIPDADVVVGTMDLGNGDSNADILQLRDCLGTVADTVVYGDPNEDEWEDDTGSIATSLAPDPGSDEAVARVSDGVDTDLSGDDFALAGPTPGAPNTYVFVPPDDTSDTGIVITAPGATALHVVINEFASNPDGGDEGNEWVELYNNEAETVDLEGWSFQSGTSSLSERHVFTGVTIEPGAMLVLGGANVQFADVTADGNLSMGNATSSGDAMRLLDATGAIADTVIYGPDNSDGFTDDLGMVATSTGAAPGNALSSGRSPDGSDTDDSGVDIVEFEEPTPGEANAFVEPAVCVPSVGTVVVNELLPNPDGTDDGQEWVELHNTGGTDVSLDGWMLEAATSDWEGPDVTFPAGVSIAPGAFFLVGGELVDDVDYLGEISLGNDSDGTGDALRLTDCQGTIVDTVIWGQTNAAGFEDDLGAVPDEAYGDPTDSALSLARSLDGVDSNAAADWTVGAPTPGASNVREVGDLPDDPIGGCGCGGGPDTTSEPGGGGCSTAPLPLGGMELIVALGVLRRRRRAF